MIEKLKPCPFCGGEGRIFHEPGSDHVAIVCQNCRSRTLVQTSDTIHKRIERAVAWWNMRPTKGDWGTFFFVLGIILINAIGLWFDTVKQADLQKAVSDLEGLIGFNMFLFLFIAWVGVKEHFNNRKKQKELGWD